MIEEVEELRENAWESAQTESVKRVAAQVMTVVVSAAIVAASQGCDRWKRQQRCLPPAAANLQ